MVDEKIYAIARKWWPEVHKALEKQGFEFLQPLHAGALEGYWRTPGSGAVITVWLRPLTSPDRQVAREMGEHADCGAGADASDCSLFARFYLHLRPFVGGPRFPPVDGRTAQKVWGLIGAVVSPYGKQVAASRLSPAPRWLALFVPRPRRYNVRSK